MARIVVTGAGGFIGGATTRALEAHYPGEVFGWTREHGDLCEQKNAEAAVRGAEIVIHTASKTAGAGVVVADPMALVTDNLILFAQVIRAAAKAKVKRFIYMSSTTGYPDADWPLYEAQYFDGEPPECYWPIGTTKRYMERLAEMYSMRGMQTIALRATNVYGPGDNFDPVTSHVIPATIRKVAERNDPIVVWGDGYDARDAIYIEDMVDAILSCMKHEPPAATAFNLALGRAYTVLEMIHILRQHEGYAPLIGFDANKPSLLRRREVNASWADDALGWKAKVGMEEGLCRTLDWYKAHAR